MLPEIKAPISILTIPSNKKKIKYKPFTVKEEKILLLASESEDPEVIILNIGEIIKNCTFNVIDSINDYPFFDIEYIFLQLRKDSVGETLNITKECPECSFEIPKELNLDDAKIEGNIDNIKININSTMSIELQYPNIKDSLKVQKDNDIFSLIADMLYLIVDENIVYKASEASSKERYDFIMNLPNTIFMECKDFLENLPKTVLKDSVTCQQCGHESEVNIEGLANFFG
jgi:hypothetical protein